MRKVDGPCGWGTAEGLQPVRTPGNESAVCGLQHVRLFSSRPGFQGALKPLACLHRGTCLRHLVFVILYLCFLAAGTLRCGKLNELWV